MKLKADGILARHSNENTCPIHDSLAEMAHGIYEILTLGKHYYRTVGAEPLDTGDAVTSTINETIDATVFDRWRTDETYRPKNLSDWAIRRSVDPSTLKQSVRAQDLTPIVSTVPA